MRTLIALVTALCLVIGAAAPADAAARGVLPVPGRVVGAFALPDVRWGSGHRGVDLAASAGVAVVAPVDGVVTFAQDLAGRPVLVLAHGDTRSTYEPVVASVDVGTRVSRGQVMGVLEAGHSCAAPVCLHWGLRRGETYLNPLSLLGGEVILLSDADAAAIRGG
ncbi:MAG TPA: peptidoglycan DD-metalloendopeptidase family protein [Propioniciclava tarda]|nr:peptidoglycan DD-metalloendopeptidase family protein [Propioniciclava tarda]